MPTPADLNDQFGIPGTLLFEHHEGLTRARITTPACTAELYLHGAHLTQWQSVDAEPVLYLSPASFFKPDKAIRGGVPVIFPWFGPRTAELTGNSTEGAQHGFARITEWTLAFAAISGDDLHLTLTLAPSDATRAAGFDHFRVALEFRLGHKLTMRMTVANQGSEPLVFEEALHTYLCVSDPEQVRMTGLANTEFIDKPDHATRKTQHAEVLTLSGETDRLYLNTTNTLRLEDPLGGRAITVAKSGSNSSVVWNPGAALTATMKDFEPDSWQDFVCVETVNAADNRITLAPQQAHVMEARISVEPLA